MMTLGDQRVFVLLREVGLSASVAFLPCLELSSLHLPHRTLTPLPLYLEGVGV